MNKKRISVTDWLLMTDAERDAWCCGVDIPIVELSPMPQATPKPKKVDWDLEMNRLWKGWLQDK